MSWATNIFLLFFFFGFTYKLILFSCSRSFSLQSSTMRWWFSLFLALSLSLSLSLLSFTNHSSFFAFSAYRIKKCKYRYRWGTLGEKKKEKIFLLPFCYPLIVSFSLLLDFRNALRQVCVCVSIQRSYFSFSDLFFLVFFPFFCPSLSLCLTVSLRRVCLLILPDHYYQCNTVINNHYPQLIRFSLPFKPQDQCSMQPSILARLLLCFLRRRRYRIKSHSHPVIYHRN